MRVRCSRCGGWQDVPDDGQQYRCSHQVLAGVHRIPVPGPLGAPTFFREQPIYQPCSSLLPVSAPPAARNAGTTPPEGGPGGIRECLGAAASRLIRQHPSRAAAHVAAIHPEPGRPAQFCAQGWAWPIGELPAEMQDRGGRRRTGLLPAGVARDGTIVHIATRADRLAPAPSYAGLLAAPPTFRLDDSQLRQLLARLESAATGLPPR